MLNVKKYISVHSKSFLTLKDPSISESCIEIKIKINSYFHTSLWCLKTFRGTTKKCENKNLT